MKAIAIALKDMKRSFRSAFALMFMFGVPLLVTGMFVLMFGSEAGEPDATITLPVTRVVVANLDAGDPALAQGMIASGSQAATLGDVIAGTLNSPALADLLTVTGVADEESARAAVDAKTADVAVIIRARFSADFAAGQTATVRLYSDPTLTAGPQVVQSLLGQAVDGISGGKIAVDLAMSNLGTASAETYVETAASASQTYAQAASVIHNPAALVELRAVSEAADTGSPLSAIIGPIMGGMMIFFAFFTGGSTSQTILQETEDGTLARLFTTPTRQSTILAGKFLAVIGVVLVQVTVLLTVANLGFGIQWGPLAAVIFAAVGIITCATAFGIFLTSLMKSTKQGGVVYGGLMTVTGMLGMVTIFTGATGGAIDTVALFTPQGWAVRGLTLAMGGAGPAEAALNMLALLALSAAFFGIGVWRFQKRFA